MSDSGHIPTHGFCYRIGAICDGVNLITQGYDNEKDRAGGAADGDVHCVLCGNRNLQTILR